MRIPFPPLRRRSGARPILVAAVGLAVTASAHPQGYPIWESIGSLTNWGHGAALSATGDIDGDGTGDLLVGSPANGIVIPATQGARVLSGSNGAVIFTFSGPPLSVSFGSAVSGVGDTDGDGVRDLLVADSAAASLFPPFSPGAGRATLFSGASGLPLLSLSGTVAGGRFGWAVAGVGDQNLDGYADVLVGSPLEGPPPNNLGAARILSGFDGSVLLALTGTWPGGLFGHAVSEVGDLDGDAVPDVIVGAPLAAPAGLMFAGEARVFSAASGAVLYTVPGATAGDHLGFAVGGPLDTNGDGLADFLVGAPQGPTYLGGGVAVGPGYAALRSGATGALLQTVTGATTGDLFGYSVAWTGDLDGDGLSDFAVGAPAADSSTSVDGGRAAVYSGATGALLLSFEGSPAGANAGWAVTGIGDANDDGNFDLAVGAPWADTTAGPITGRISLLSAVGIPSGSGSFGAGCAGSGGFTPAAATFGGPPTPGNADFGLSLARGLGGSLAFLFASTAVNPVGIPVSGCEVNLAGSIFFLPPASILPGPPGVPGAGFRLRSLGVPPNPVLVGVVVPFQWVVVDGGSPNGLFTTSSAVAVAIL